MTPARSLAASVVVLGFAGTLTTPMPALAAPTPCGRVENFAAQSGAELLKINRLTMRAANTAGADAGGADADGADAGGADVDGADAGGAESGKIAPSGTGPTEAAGDSPSPDGSDANDGGDDADIAKGSGKPSAGSATAGPAEGRDTVLVGVGLGDTQTALVSTAQVHSAAVARMLDGQSAAAGPLADPVIQQAPPNNAKATQHATPAGRVGPMKLGAGQIEAHAQWDTGTACGNTAADAASSATSLDRADLVSGRNGALVRVPERISSRSTTVLERRDGDPQTVASATVTAGRILLADGRVTVRVLRAPTLTARMSATTGGEVYYQPAIVEVSGRGIKTTRLDSEGDDVEVSLRDTFQRAESASLSALSNLDGVQPTPPLPLPSVPDLPSLTESDTESAPAAGFGAANGADSGGAIGGGSGAGNAGGGGTGGGTGTGTGGGTGTGIGTQIRIALGDARQAKTAHAIAAEAATIKLSITQTAPAKFQTGYAGAGSVALNLTVGGLVVAAVAPQDVTAAGTGPDDSGSGLPITGPQAGLIALAGVGLLITGIGAVLYSIRRRRTHL